MREPRGSCGAGRGTVTGQSRRGGGRGDPAAGVGLTPGERGHPVRDNRCDPGPRSRPRPAAVAQLCLAAWLEHGTTRLDLKDKEYYATSR